MRIVTLIIVAVIGFSVWFLGFQIDQTRAMYGYLFAFTSILTIPLGCMFFVLIQHLTRAGWSVLVRRVAEFGMAAVPLFAFLFVPVVYFGEALFPWSQVAHLDETLLKKTPYLNLDFFTVRAVIYFAIWSFIGLFFYQKSLQQDAGNQPGITKLFWKISPVCMILFAFSTSFASFDWLMSLEPHWYSTVYGVYFFAGCFLAGLCFMTLVLLRSRVPVTGEHYHDLGKLIFGFTVFWAYIGFSQFMLYWYANIPEETEFYIHRLHHGWEFISYGLIITNFFFPFFLLMSRHAKKNKKVLTFSCLWVLLAHFLDVYWLVIPNTRASNWGLFLPYDLAALVGILALYVGVVTYLMRGKSLIPKGDPRLQESFRFENF